MSTHVPLDWNLNFYRAVHLVLVCILVRFKIGDVYCSLLYSFGDFSSSLSTVEQQISSVLWLSLYNFHMVRYRNALNILLIRVQSFLCIPIAHYMLLQIEHAQSQFSILQWLIN